MWLSTFGMSSFLQSDPTIISYLFIWTKILMPMVVALKISIDLHLQKTGKLISKKCSIKMRTYGIREFEFEEEEAPQVKDTMESESCNPTGRAGSTKLNAFMMDNGNSIQSHKLETVGKHRGDSSALPSGEIYAVKYHPVSNFGVSMSFLDDSLFSEGVRDNLVETGTIITNTGDITTTYEQPLPPPNKNYREYSKRDNRVGDALKGNSWLDQLKRTEVSQPVHKSAGRSEGAIFENVYEPIRDESKMREMRDIFFNRNGLTPNDTNLQTKDPFGYIGEQNFVRINPYMPSTQSFSFEDEGTYNRNTHEEFGAYTFDNSMFDEMKSKKTRLDVPKRSPSQIYEAQRTVPVQDVLKTMREQKSSSADRNLQSELEGKSTGYMNVDHVSERIFKATGPINVHSIVPSGSLNQIEMDDVIKMLNKDQFNRSRVVPTDGIDASRAKTHDSLKIKPKDYMFSQSKAQITDGYVGDAVRRYTEDKQTRRNLDNINDEEIQHMSSGVVETFPTRDVEVQNHDVTSENRIPGSNIDELSRILGESMVNRRESEIQIRTAPEISIQ